MPIIKLRGAVRHNYAGLNAVMTVFLAAGEEIEVLFNGPMRSGIALDSQAILNAGYRDFQNKLAAQLRDLYLGAWECPPFGHHRNHLSFDIDTFQGDTVIPRYLISRAFTEEDLEHILEEFRLPAEVRPARSIKHRDDGDSDDEEGHDGKPVPATFRIHRLDIYLYDFGYASCMIHGNVVALKDLSIDDVRAVAENIGAALPDYGELFQGTLAKIAKIIPPEFILHNTLGDHRQPPQWPGTTLHQHVGELFWVHRIFSVPCRNAAEFARRKEECKVLAGGGHTHGMEDKSLRPDMAVYPGHGNSCVVYTKNATPDWHASRLRGVIRAMNVFYAALQDADRDHFHLNNDMARRLMSHELETVERQMQYMAGGLARTGFIKSVYDDYDNQLDPQSFALWDFLRKTWYMGDLFRGLDQKAAMTEKGYDRLSKRLADLRQRRTAQIAFMMIGLFCLAGMLPSLEGPRQGLAVAIVLAFAFGAATLMAVRFFKTK